MTVEEFVEEYTWRRAREMQAEMLAQSSRRYLAIRSGAHV